MAKKLFITTAIPYSNSSPHIGFALEIIQADVLARYHRLIGNDVYFLTGTDENALKNVQAAEKEKITTKELVDKYSAEFKQLKSALGLSFDDFIRTTEERHIKGSQKLWSACLKDIYKKQYEGMYCVGCEEFKTEKDIIDGKCPEHPDKELEFVKEENYFFRLSAYQKQITELIETDRLKITPAFRKKEVLTFVKTGLNDISISRSKKRAKNWGIPVPGDPDQVIYVWFDALINYITGLGYADNNTLFDKFWLNNKNIIHCIGKGIIRFHAVYWPAMLLSAGLTLPTKELVHGYITSNGEKMSKSLGNVVNPFELVKKYGTDAVRYYLLKEIPPFKDGDFTIRHFEEVYNADLANGIGNLVQRVAKMAENLSNSKHSSAFDIELNKISTLLDKYRFNTALSEIWLKIRKLDQIINTQKPWEKQEEEKNQILDDLIREILQIAGLLKPFLPDTAEKIKAIFTAGQIKAPSKPLFPRAV